MSEQVFINRDQRVEFLKQQGCTFQYDNKDVVIYRDVDGELQQLYPKSQLEPWLYDVTRFADPVEPDHDNDYYGLGGREDDGMIALNIPDDPAPESGQP